MRSLIVTHTQELKSAWQYKFIMTSKLQDGFIWFHFLILWMGKT